jgi:competence protein ComEC
MSKIQRSPVALPLLFFIIGIGVEEEFVLGIALFVLMSYVVLLFSNKLKFSRELLFLSLRSILLACLFFFLGKINVVLNATSVKPTVDKIYFDTLFIKNTEGVKFTERGCWMLAPAFNTNNAFDVLVNMDSVRGVALEKGDTLVLREVSLLPLLKLGKEPSSWDEYLLRQGIQHKIYVNVRSKTELRKNQSWFYSFYNLAHRKIRLSALSQKSKSLLLSLLIGDRGYVDKQTKEDYAVLGVSHILSVSGLHVGIIYLVISWIIALFLNKRSLVAVFLVLILIWFYCWMVGFSPPVLRSALMFSLYIIGSAMGKGSVLLHTTCLSAFVILLIDPLYLYDIGFQLTYGAMLGIIFIMPVFSERWPIKNFFLKPLCDLIFLSIAVQITLLPFLIYYFEYLSVYFIVANLVIVPAVALLMYLGIAFVLLPYHWLFSAAIDYVVLFMDWFCEEVSCWPYTTLPFAVSSLCCWLLYGLCVGLFLQYKNYRLNWFLYLGASTLFGAILLI